MPTRTQTPTVLVLISLASLVARPPWPMPRRPPRNRQPPAPKPGGQNRPPPEKLGRCKRQEGVRQAIAAYGRALAQGDVQAMAKFWTADGDYVGPSGRSVKARRHSRRERRAKTIPR